MTSNFIFNNNNLAVLLKIVWDGGENLKTMSLTMPARKILGNKYKKSCIRLLPENLIAKIKED